MHLHLRKISGILAAMLWGMVANAAELIVVPPIAGDATAQIQAAIDSAATFNGKPVVIRLSPGNYNISRANSSQHLYHVSNTSSASENPDQTKHIGLWFRGLKNITLDGNGAWIVTHGEMTPIVLDNCRNISLTNFTLSAADPSVPEMTIVATTDKSITFAVTPPSRFEIVDGDFAWVGEGWRFADGRRETVYPEFAQVFYPERNVTLRCPSPLQGRKKARQLDDNIVKIEYDKAPDVHVGEVYQMRHGIRNEVCTFIKECKDIRLANIEFNFLGNFGIVGQFSENLTYDNIRCRPRLGSGRTNAGFADFVQMSGCKGKIRIANSYFEGAHDDPINIHGTHLKAVATDGASKLTVRFMHDQSYGFTPFYKGDKVELVDRHTLRCIVPATVKDVRQINDYDYQLTLDRAVPQLPDGYNIDDIAVENVTWTPDVEIVNNYFARIPTRGILITTRGKSLIEGNTFFRMPMPAILVSDDARGWYESGPVKDLTIRGNDFIDCASPAIAVWPEIDRYDGPVHSNIVIEGNRFSGNGATTISLRAADGITICNNVFCVPQGSDATLNTLIQHENTTGLKTNNNSIIQTP